MKSIRYIFLAAGLILLSSCVKDPWSDVEKGDWNHERSILSIKFEGQAGIVTIENDDATTGTIDVTLLTDFILDLSKVKVEQVTYSYNAEGSVQSGDYFDFTVASPSITVKATTGEERKYSINMTSFTETLGGVYKMSHLWLWGGTGPEYNCTKLYDLYNKSANFVSDNGRGVEAEKDNYLEIVFEGLTEDGNTTGTCYNWAGEDVHNCGFVYAAGKNPTNKDIDLSANYRRVPVGQSTWVRDYINNTVTFTAADGTTTVCELTEPGSISLPNTPVITLTLENQAFYFTLEGKDDWTDAWNDYGVIVRHPRRLYVEIEKVDGDVPETSKTVEEYVAPEPDPDPDPVPDPEPVDYSALKGIYNVYGDNSTYGLWVFGGTSDPAFVSPVEKSWDWNDSIKKESDNELAFNVKEVTETTVTGTLTYKAGTDGAYWDYVWKSTSTDLSSLYDKLPHSETTFSIDIATGVVTLGNGTTATFLTPGTYKYGVDIYGEDNAKTKEVPQNCIAFDFAISGDGDTSSPWTDVDRFVHGPKNYLMIFEYTGEYTEPSPLESLPGTYNVYGDNSTYGIWVFGGATDPALVSPIAKSWVFDSTIWKESDNGLSVTVTSMEGTTVKGIVNWWSGADGSFWDYIMVANYNKLDGTDLDLSTYYNKIPKGKSEYTLDASTMTVTFSNGNTATLLLPGTYKYGVDVYGEANAKTLTVNEGCFAFDFALPGYTTPNSTYAWTDFDRFAYGPRNYIMIFEKTE